MRGSYFSRVDGAAMCSPLRRGLWSRVGVHIGAPVAADEVSPTDLQQQVLGLLHS